MTNNELFAAAVASFEAARQSFEAARIALQAVIDLQVVEAIDEVEDPQNCQHVEAVEISTMGDGGPVYLCPDCDEQFV